jgi:uncharacterized membrane protein YgcG
MMLSSFSPASAEVRVVSAQGEYRMGDRDTKEDAMRLATEAAKRHALEQVATYLESVTTIEGVDITKDEIRTYSAGLVLVLDQQTNLTLEGDTVVLTVDLTAQVDTEEVTHAIVALRENEDARHQLAALRNEIDDLHNELESANLALAAATTAEQVQQASLQRQEVLDRVQSNAMVSQAWTDWIVVAPVVYPYPWMGVAQTQAVLGVARRLYPASPYVQTAQQAIVMKQPPLPAQPPTPQVPQQSQLAPLTLNEISHTTQTSPIRVGNQPAGLTRMAPVQTGSRTMSDVRRLTPFLMSPGGTPSAGQQPIPHGSQSVRTLQQFLQPPATVPPAGQPPVARRLPPTMNQIHPSFPHQVPRMPYRFSPQGSRGGGHFGGHFGGGGRGGGGRGGGRGR